MKILGPEDLVGGFKRLFDRIEYREKIEEDIDNFRENKKQLYEDPDSIVAIEKLGELIASRNYYRGKYAKDFKSKFEKVKHLDSGFFRTKRGKEILIAIIREAAFKKDSAEKKMRDLLDELGQGSINVWTRRLHTLSQQGKGDEILGPKGRDIYLRDMGYFDRVPMDIHEMRFIIRTGIYHLCSRGQFDPLKEGHLQSAIVNFCKEYLSGLSICNIDLSKSPGIVDLIIWYHCADPPGFGTCAVEPKCLENKDICPLSQACFFSIMKKNT